MNVNQVCDKIQTAILANDSVKVHQHVEQIIQNATPNQIQQILSHQMGGTTLVGAANGNLIHKQQQLLNANQITQSLGALQQAAQPNQLEGWQNPLPHPANTR